MKNRIDCGAMVLLASLLASPAAQAQLSYATNNGVITITGYTGSGGAVIIPGQITGLPVTAIGDWAFYSTGVINVTISDTVTNIGDGAFIDCESVTNIAIGANVASIGDWAFAFCSSLTNVNFRGNPPGLGGTNVFYGDSATVTVNYLPGSAGWWPMFGGLAAVLWNPPVSYAYTTNNCTITITRYTGSGGSLVIPGAINFLPVTTIGNSAFYEGTELINVTIPDTVTNIGDDAFELCESLTNVTLPASVTTIGDGAFSYCILLRSVAIPTNLTRIGNYVFQHCLSLTSIKIPGGIASIGGYAFYYCFGLTNATLPNGLLCIGSNAFGECTVLTGITIPGSVTEIGDSAFADCGLASLTIPGSVSNIGEGAFAGCRITKLTIPTNITSIANGVFSGCSFLTNVSIPDTVTSLGDGAFAACIMLRSVTIPASVTYFAANAFAASVKNIYLQGNAPVLGPNIPDLGAPLEGIAYYLPNTTGWSNCFDGVPAVLWNPLIQTADASFGVRTNQFGFNITGTPDIPIVVQAADNLANPVWTPLQSLTLTNGSYYFSEPFQPATPARFYRITSQ